MDFKMSYKEERRIIREETWRDKTRDCKKYKAYVHPGSNQSKYITFWSVLIWPEDN